MNETGMKTIKHCQMLQPTGVALLLLLLVVPFTTRPHLQEGARQVCGAGGAALLTACVVWLYNVQATTTTMDDHHPGSTIHTDRHRNSWYSPGAWKLFVSLFTIAIPNSDIYSWWTLIGD